jgi:DNA-binding CsgD family transcriptional regulator
MTAVQNNCLPGADTPAALLGLQRLIDRLTAPVLVFDLRARHGCFGNAAAAALMGIPWPVPQEMWRTNLDEVVGPRVAAQMEQGLAALRTGAMRSYHGDRTYSNCNGEPIHAHHTVTRLDLCDAPPMAVAVVAQRLYGSARSIAPALATLNHDWRVDVLSPDVEPRLGLASTALLGSHLTNHVHPEDEAELVQAFERASEVDAVATTVRLRVDDDWRTVDLLVGALCHHRPHRVGLLVAVNRRAEHISDASSSAAGGLLVSGEELSAQQHEVVKRLLRGESIATIAAGLHLSRSTVRNHLCAVYAKAGVHSQSELIAHVTGRRAVHSERGNNKLWQ